MKQINNFLGLYEKKKLFQNFFSPLFWTNGNNFCNSAEDGQSAYGMHYLKNYYVL